MVRRAATRADKVYESEGGEACQAVDAILAEYQITDVVVGKDAKYFGDCENLSEIYSDKLYRIFEVQP